MSQSFGAASKSSGFSGVDGILGLGPVDLTEGTVSGSSTVPTVLDSLLSQGIIVSLLNYSFTYNAQLKLLESTEVVGIYFAPESGSDTDDANGELTFGGVDTVKYTGTLHYFPKSTTSPYSL